MLCHREMWYMFGSAVRVLLGGRAVLGWGHQSPVLAGRWSQRVVPPSLPVMEAACLVHSQADITEVHPELRKPCVPPHTAAWLANQHWGWGSFPHCPPSSSRLPAQRDSFFIVFTFLLSFLGHIPCPSPTSSLVKWRKLPQAPVPSLISCCQEGKHDCSFN